MIDRHFTIEQKIWERGIEFIAGVDEAGRGPLAGPVVAAAVVFPRGFWLEGVDDSKKLSAKQREILYDSIMKSAFRMGVARVEHEEIDRINILQASLHAMKLAIDQINPAPQHLLIDGPIYRDHTIPFDAIVDGDAKCFSIAAASIIAKVTRDRIMLEYDKKYPEYGFARHKGYGTKEHLLAIRKYGPCEIHRKSFHPVADEVEQKI
jgi:ribonuclease HII